MKIMEPIRAFARGPYGRNTQAATTHAHPKGCGFRPRSIRCIGFTLVELMVTVSILAVGIVLVLRSFLSISAALDSGSNRIIAMQLLEDKMNVLEQEAKVEAGVFPETKEEEAMVGNRDATLKLEVVNLSTPEFPLSGQEEEIDKEKINEVKLTLLWKEAGIDKDTILVTYFKNKETEVE